MICTLYMLLLQLFEVTQVSRTRPLRSVDRSLVRPGSAAKISAVGKKNF